MADLMIDSPVTRGLNGVLAEFGIVEAAYLAIEDTKMAAITITDQPYRDIALVRMIARDIIEPNVGRVTQMASGASFGDNPKVGAVFFVYADDLVSA